MASIHTPTQTEQGWVVDIPEEIARAQNVPEGSMVLMHFKDGNLSLEILPPPSPALVESSRRIANKYKEAFAEMKRHGD